MSLINTFSCSLSYYYFFIPPLVSRCLVSVFYQSTCFSVVSRSLFNRLITKKLTLMPSIAGRKYLHKPRPRHYSSLWLISASFFTECLRGYVWTPMMVIGNNFRNVRVKIFLFQIVSIDFLVLAVVSGRGIQLNRIWGHRKMTF